ncbi:lichenicidin A2 family type 2 lantibiotic [Bacillus sp. BH2]|uniref:mersacidin family lantibiotic n=1 Tax=Bacillus sp. BH2 TaxID=2528958 RepID=UPI001F0F2BE8|nr:lichenicidin A2 family type 2 lantibiotic [Bacillus sp. BH2]
MNNFEDKVFKNMEDRFENVGDAFEDMTLEDMALAQGSGDIQPRTTPGCFFASLGVSVTISAWSC